MTEAVFHSLLPPAVAPVLAQVLPVTVFLVACVSPATLTIR